MILRIILIIASYMIGSLSTSIILCRVKYGVDIRTLGSGNAGTTNVLRNFGKKAAGVTLLLDALKGVPCYLAGYFLCHSYGVALACGLAAILGHIYPVWYQFRGGKGVATT
ncbi:MAG: glycerol-3-phosphate acyltransferase, partial [Firmicutes bacterium]|nr:glycerol-3-phosphate acyltransferase [Bacillota bacterium]